MPETRSGGDHEVGARTSLTRCEGSCAVARASRREREASAASDLVRGRAIACRAIVSEVPRRGRRASARSEDNPAKKIARSDRDGLSTDHERDIATDMRSSRSESAIENWIAALNEKGRSSRVRVEAAVHPEIRVERFGFGANAGRLVEVIRGTEGVAEWFGITPEVVQFELAGPVEVEGEGSGVEKVGYRVVAGEFVGHGTWRFRLHDDGRIVWLEHRPDDIPDAVQEGSFRIGEGRMHGDHPHHGEHHHHHH